MSGLLGPVEIAERCVIELPLSITGPARWLLLGPGSAYECHLAGVGEALADEGGEALLDGVGVAEGGAGDGAGEVVVGGRQEVVLGQLVGGGLVGEEEVEGGGAEGGDLGGGVAVAGVGGVGGPVEAGGPAVTEPELGVGVGGQFGEVAVLASGDEPGELVTDSTSGVTPGVRVCQPGAGPEVIAGLRSRGARRSGSRRGCRSSRVRRRAAWRPGRRRRGCAARACGRRGRRRG